MSSILDSIYDPIKSTTGHCNCNVWQRVYAVNEISNFTLVEHGLTWRISFISSLIREGIRVIWDRLTRCMDLSSVHIKPKTQNNVNKSEREMRHAIKLNDKHRQMNNEMSDDKK